jgi:hypothetical protein
MSETVKIKRTLGRMLAALGADLATARATDWGSTVVTMTDGSRLAWSRSTDPEDEAPFTWEHSTAGGRYIADGASEDAYWLAQDLASHLRAA